MKYIHLKEFPNFVLESVRNNDNFGNKEYSWCLDSIWCFYKIFKNISSSTHKTQEWKSDILLNKSSQT